MLKVIRSASLALAVCGAMLAIQNSANAQFPGFGADTLGPALLITLGPGGAAAVTAGPGFAQGPYDSVEDTYIGVINASGATVSSIPIQAASASDVFGFDGDGIDTFGAVKVAGNPDTTGYGGPITFFTAIHTVGANDLATLNFFGGLANLGTTYFSLEGPLNLSSIIVGAVPLPATWTMLLIGFAGLGFLAYRGAKKGSAAMAAA